MRADDEKPTRPSQGEIDMRIRRGRKGIYLQFKSIFDKTHKDVLPLAMTTPGERVRIVEIRGGRGFEGRLASMGLKRGTEIEVINSNAPGPVIVASGETRLAIGRGMAQKIFVSSV